MPHLAEPHILKGIALSGLAEWRPTLLLAR